MVSRSSLAARRGVRGSSIGSNTGRVLSAGRASKVGASKTGGVGGGTGGAFSVRTAEVRLVSAAVSLMFRASWIAESATSVGSLTFLGVFAMFSLSPRYLYTSPREPCALREPTDRFMPLERIQSRPTPDRLSAYFRKH